VIQETFNLGDIHPVHVLGLNDIYLRKLERRFPDVQISARGGRIYLEGRRNRVRFVSDIIGGLLKIARNADQVTELDFQTLLQLEEARTDAPPINDAIQDLTDDGFILKSPSGQFVRAKTPGQRDIVNYLAKNDILFAIGPAGTGKTYTSVALAVKALKEKSVKKIVLCRPAVEAGESLGYLPGNLRDKIDPYLRPLYDALEEMLEYDRLKEHMERNIIEIAPLAYMRGRTLNNAFVILDEAQNATRMQMKMFLTRLGMGSKAIITGDITQTDLPRKKDSGLISVPYILRGIEGISFVYLDQRDVVRHRLVREIITAYERHQDIEEQREASLKENVAVALTSEENIENGEAKNA
jgi:phosphate starvation-inducible PhoH-like protein